jgi:L-asparaginase / beta-aspartyl-peptidase
MSDACWTVVVHGGAKEIDPADAEANREGCRRAAAAAASVLRAGGPALHAVQTAIRSMEDDPTFNAGHGAVLTAAGTVEMDAALMDGTTLGIGAVAAVTRVRNPIDAAKVVLPADPVLLVSEGAEAFVQRQGIPLVDPGEFETIAQEEMRDTVGAVALDCHGHLAAGTSTGGLSGQVPGRVGDSVMPGAGFYADDRLGATALSGDGEQIARASLAAHVMAGLEFWSAGPATMHALARLHRVGGEAGLITLDRQGRVGIAHNSRHFALALASRAIDDTPAGITRDELHDWIDHG